MTHSEREAYQQALERIEYCRSRGAKGVSLDLSKLGLTALPPEIGALNSLATLHLYSNQLRSLPPEIGKLASLKELDISDNRLISLPTEIGKLKVLSSLNVSGNQLTALPPEIGSLSELNILGLNNNLLASLPPEIGQLHELKSLGINDNRLASLPAEIGRLTALTNLGLSGNKLDSLPPEIGNLNSLQTLYLHKNQLASMPTEIMNMKSLLQLYLHGNSKLEIPRSILGSSPIRRRLDKFLDPIVRPSDILGFYFSRLNAKSSDDLRPLNEIKVMLVGRGGSGKTSLRRFFMGQPHDKDEKETPGIALDSFTMKRGQQLLTVRLWDFAGQEITHAMHQFFLTEGCVYILTLDPRSNTEMQDAEYWLGLIKRYAGRAPVLVALNHQDARKGGYDVDRGPLKERYSFIYDYVPTNCETRDGCHHLKETLLGAISAMPETEPPHLLVPKNWLGILNECVGLADGNITGRMSGAIRNHMKLDEFRDICAKYNETEPQAQERLARLLHKLGAVLHFVDEPRLRDTSVLNPHWVTDGVYRLLRYKDRPGSDGTLALKEAMAALPGETKDSALFFLRLMERFEMCFAVEADNESESPELWLIPGALDEFQPASIGKEWQEHGAVRLRYIYDQLPEGVLPRFIVMTHPLSKGQPRWRRGVVLRDGQAKAMVRRSQSSNTVEIIAFGPETERLQLIEIIRGTFDRIHADLPKPSPLEDLELTKAPGVYHSIENLEAAESENVPIVLRVDGNNKRIEPTAELNKASEPESRNPERVPLRSFLSYSHYDKSAKSIFQLNMSVMQKKNLITPWHDGMIEPGTEWLKAIQDNLAVMDIFIGLLTTAFLDSDFIEKIELKAAREKLRRDGRDFHFVLILVDDISLTRLDLADYQILKPGGKAVTQHKSRKDGFNQAQKELDKWIIGWQAEKQDKHRGP